MKKVLKWIGVFFLVIIVIGIFAGKEDSSTKDGEPGVKASSSSVADNKSAGNNEAANKFSANEMDALKALVKDDIKTNLTGGDSHYDYGYTPVTAQGIYKVYSANEARGDKTYKNKKLIVSGTVESVTSSIGDIPVISLKTGDMFNTVNVNMARKYRELATDLNKNQKVSFACVGGTVVIGMPSVRDCRPVDVVTSELTEGKMDELDRAIKNPGKVSKEDMILLSYIKLVSKATNDFQTCKTNDINCFNKKMDAYLKGKDRKKEGQAIKAELGFESPIDAKP